MYDTYKKISNKRLKMKIVLSFLLMIHTLFAMEYYAKIEPLHTYVIKSAVSGKVQYVNSDIEGKQAHNSMIIKIDSVLNEEELQQTQKKLVSTESMITLEEKNYQRLKKVTSKSGFEKDTQKIKVLTLQTQKSDLMIKIATLKDTIKNKKLLEKDAYIYNIAVKEGDYVTPGTLLYEKNDLTKGKVEIFIPIDEVKTLQNKTIFLNGEKSKLQIDKIYKVADDKHISSYKCEIIIPNVQAFSRLVKIEFK